LAIAGLIAAVLVGAAGVSLHQAAVARHAAADAARESKRRQAVQSFLLDVFGATPAPGRPAARAPDDGARAPRRRRGAPPMH